MNLQRVLLYKYGNKSWSLRGDSYDGIIWTDTETEKPTEQELLDVWESQEFSNAMGAQAAIEKRKEKILGSWPVHEQFEALTEASMGRTEKLEELKNFIISVKEEFPKD